MPITVYQTYITLVFQVIFVFLNLIFLHQLKYNFSSTDFYCFNFILSLGLLINSLFTGFDIGLIELLFHDICT